LAICVIRLRITKGVTRWPPNPIDIILGVPDQRRQVQVEQDDVVVVKFAEIASLFTRSVV
jgi:hypothetical protein